MEAEGECPECGRDIGVRIDSSIAAMLGDTIERMMDRDGNAMRCSYCKEYVEPKGIRINDGG